MIYRSRFLTHAEVWFDEEPKDTHGADCIVYHQRSCPLPGTNAKPFYTYAIDLTRSRDQLWANLTRDTAYKIRRARERDKIVCECCDLRDPAAIAGFEEMYNHFAESKGLAPLERARTESLAAAGRLDLSVAKDPQGRALVYHANYCDCRRASGLELASLHRTVSDGARRHLIGRANRYLTWTEILRYQERGLKFFDFGGWYYGTDPARLRVNDFKQGFGGQVLHEFECEKILTLKGWLGFCIGRLLGRKNSLRRDSKGQLADIPPGFAPESGLPAPTD